MLVWRLVAMACPPCGPPVWAARGFVEWDPSGPSVVDEVDGVIGVVRIDGGVIRIDGVVEGGDEQHAALGVVFNRDHMSGPCEWDGMHARRDHAAARDIDVLDQQAVSGTTGRRREKVSVRGQRA